MLEIMKRWIVVGVMTLAFLGLVFVQIRLLWIGVLLEMKRFDRQVWDVLKEMQEDILENDTLVREISIISTVSPNYYIIRKDTLIDRVERELQQLFVRKFQEKNISTRFSFTITDKTGTEVFLRSSRSVEKETQNDRYQIFLGGDLVKYCRCERYLRLYINNLFQYLLSQLAYLIIPSLLFLLALVGCFVFFLRATGRLQRLDDVKNDFINNLTHELKTPVFSIGLTSRMLEESLRQRDYEKANRFLPLLHKENEKLKGHIDKVLELASLESGRYNLQKEVLELHELLADTVEQYTVKLNLSEGLLHRDLRATATTILADRAHLTNAIQNLLENAIKYNERTPEITIRTINDKESVVLSIQDNGIGIAAEHQKAIFEKFFRVSNGNVHTVKGFGLGLHYVRHIIEAHNGRIVVESQPGTGSIFRISLPLAK